ncbi:hypothetical protein MHYP_G00285910 [Metynnis hypsauchen]
MPHGFRGGPLIWEAALSEAEKEEAGNEVSCENGKSDYWLPEVQLHATRRSWQLFFFPSWAGLSASPPRPRRLTEEELAACAIGC